MSDRIIVMVGGVLCLLVFVLLLVFEAPIRVFLYRHGMGHSRIVDDHIAEKVTRGVSIFGIVLSCLVIVMALLPGSGRKNAVERSDATLSTISLPPMTTSTEGRPSSTTGESANEEFVFTGMGDATIDLPKGHDRVVVRAAHEADGRFVVEVLATDGRTPENKLVVGTSSGPYEGWGLITVPVADVAGLQVSATGAWTIELVSADGVPRVGEEFRGRNDSVMWYDGPGGSATISRPGGGPFEIATLDGRFLLPPVLTAAFEGIERWPAGPFLFKVRADGEWSVSIDADESTSESADVVGIEVPAALAMHAEECLSHWVELQRVVHSGVVEKDRWQPVAEAFYSYCEKARDGLRPLKLRSPQGTPVHMLWTSLTAAQGTLGLFERLTLRECNDPCVIAPEDGATPREPDPELYPGVPVALQRYLGDLDVDSYLSLIPGLVVGE